MRAGTSVLTAFVPLGSLLDVLALGDGKARRVLRAISRGCSISCYARLEASLGNRLIKVGLVIRLTAVCAAFGESTVSPTW